MSFVIDIILFCIIAPFAAYALAGVIWLILAPFEAIGDCINHVSKASANRRKAEAANSANTKPKLSYQITAGIIAAIFFIAMTINLIHVLKKN